MIFFREFVDDEFVFIGGRAVGMHKDERRARASLEDVNAPHACFDKPVLRVHFASLNVLARCVNYSAATLAAVASGSRWRIFGATSSMKSFIERASFSGVA